MHGPLDSRHPLVGLIDEVLRVQGRIKSTFAAARRAVGLNDSELMVLTAVVEAAHPVTVPQIGRSLGAPRQRVQRAANGLAAAGLIAQAANPDHKRAQLLSATTEGLALKRRADAAADQVAAELSQALDHARLREMTQSLKALRRQLETEMREGRSDGASAV